MNAEPYQYRITTQGRAYLCKEIEDISCDGCISALGVVRESDAESDNKREVPWMYFFGDIILEPLQVDDKEVVESQFARSFAERHQ